MSRPLLAERRFAPLFACQFLSAFGDNFLRNALGLLVVWSQGAAPGWIVAAASGAFVLPSVLLSGLGGQLADRMDKARLIRRLKFAEVAIAAAATLGLAAGSLSVLFAGLVASGVVASLFGPVKYGILPDQLPRERLTSANALVEGATFAAILAGTVASGLLVGGGGRPFAVGLVVLATAALSWGVAALVPATRPNPALHVQADIVASTLDLLRGLRADRRIWKAALANAWFWVVGSVVISLLPGLVRDSLGGGAGMDTAFLCLFAVGIACGSALASFLSGARTVLLPAGLGSAVFGCALVDLWFATHGHATPAALAQGLGRARAGHAGVDLFLAALGGGLLAVPTLSAIQAWSPPERRSRGVAGVNVLAALSMAVTASLLVAAQIAGLGAPALLGVTGLLCLAAAPAMLLGLPENPLGEAAWLLFRVLFRIRLHGAEHLPRPGQPALLTPNHVSWLDATALFAVMEQRPLFAVDAQVARRWWVRPLLRLVAALPVEPSSPYAVRTMVGAVKGGAQLVLFPEGRITVTGSLMEVQHGAATVADKADVSVVPVRLEGLERTVFSRLAASQTRRALFPRVTVTVLPQQRLRAPDGVVGRARREALTACLRDVMEEAVYLATPCDLTLFQAVARAARAHGMGRLAVEDPVAGPLSYRRMLAGADVLGQALARGTDPDEAVGLLLPTANATALCLLGLWSWGRVPALLNATAGLASLRAAVAAAEVGVVVTSRAFVDKARLAPVLAGLEDRVRVVFLEDVRAGVTRGRRLRALLRASLLTTRPRLHRMPEDRAVVMFTSGSSGTPKGVVLTHRNLLANVAQVGGRIGFGRADRVLNTLPMFHAFGLTGGFLLPVTSGIPAFLYPSPLHYAVIPQVAYGWNATALFGTSTFLRGYARRAQPTAFRSLRLVVAGAERVQPAVREQWMERFGLRILEGYGATECSPVLALNTPVSNRSGTLGRLLPGMAARLAPVDGLPDAGRLSVSGPNVMAGYLLADRPGRLQPPPDGWHDTGDIVSVGEDGHLAIVGRASRIAKPGGEMVSLSAVEDLAAGVWPEALSVAVALPDPRKGERIVLLTEQAGATRSALQAHARVAGASELLLPAELRVVERLPLLGSGKPDLLAAQQLADGGTGSVAQDQSAPATRGSAGGHCTPTPDLPEAGRAQNAAAGPGGDRR